MARKTSFFTVKEAPSNRQTMKLLRELPDRLEAAAAQMTIGAATIILEELEQSMPQIRGFGDLRKRLAIRRVIEGVSGSAHAVVLEAGTGSQKLSEDEVSNTMLTFEPIRGAQSTPTSEFLVETSPWPADMVPFRPPNGRLKVKARIISDAEMVRVRNRLREVWPEMKTKATSRGVELPEQPASFGDQEVTKNLAWQILRTEFGVGEPSKPHWRPAIRKVKQRSPALYRSIQRTLTDPSYSGWRRLVPIPGLTRGEMRAIEDFQAKL